MLGEVAAVLRERLVLVLGVLVGDPLAAAQLPQRLHDRVARRALGLEQLPRAAALLEQGQQQVLRGDEVVAEVLASLAARSRTVRKARLGCGPPVVAVPEMRGSFSSAASTSLRSARVSTPELERRFYYN